MSDDILEKISDLRDSVYKLSERVSRIEGYLSRPEFHDLTQKGIEIMLSYGKSVKMETKK